MTYKSNLLVVLALILMNFQQVPGLAGSSIVKGNPSPLGLAKPSAPVAAVLTQVSVTVYQLDPNSGLKVVDSHGHYHKCTANDTVFGCVETLGSAPAGTTYPYSKNPVLLNMDSQYLPEVLASELGNQFDYTASTITWDQAIASRTVIDWKYRYKGSVDNSTIFQLFVPLGFEYLIGSTALALPLDPCNATNVLNQRQQLVCGGINATPGQFLADNSGASVDAEYFSDVALQTLNEGSKTYLISVNDPISTAACGAPSNPVGNGWGMSQKGAIRWLIGNQCANQYDQNAHNNGQPKPWSVTWSDYRQILAHYYTGIDILDAYNNSHVPPDRWNLLSHDIPMHSIAGNFVPGNYGGSGTNEGNVYYQMNPGQTYNVNLSLQNTSSLQWNNVVLGYQWTPVGGTLGNWQTLVSLPSTSPGSSQAVIPSIPAPSASGIYTLHLDLEHQGGAWFSNSGWPDAEISPVYVYNYVVPIIQNGGGDTSSDDGGTNPTPCTFSGTDNEVYLGACFNGQDITSGFRFQFPQNNGIPAGTNNIKNAYLIFSTDTYNVEIDVQISGEKSLSSPTFSTSNPPSSPTRVLTSNKILWAITDPWTWRGTYYTPDISPIIQEIVSQPGWSTSYPISIIITNVHNMPGSLNVRRVQAYEGSWNIGLSYPAILVVNTQ